MTKSFVKKGDKVLVITGKEKGKVADVVSVSPKTGKVLVDGVNVVTKHQKPKSQQDKGGIIKKSAPINASNVMVVCPVCNKAVRVKHKEIEGKNARYCVKCGASLDKEFVKATKKDAKKAVKETKKAQKEQKGDNE